MEITPEERATKLVRTSADDWSISGLERGQMVLEIAAAIREAVEAEREGCVEMLNDMEKRSENEVTKAAYGIAARSVCARSRQNLFEDCVFITTQVR